MKIKIKRLSSDAVIPTYATSGSCGMDLYSTSEIVLAPHERCAVPTDIAVEIPEGYYGHVSGRSGKFVKEGLLCATGLIDSDYRNGIGVMVFNTTEGHIAIHKGERCGQLMILPYPRVELVETDALSEGGHGEGFGHTGKF